MFRIPGFSQNSLNTSLGKIVYYTADRAPWLREEVSDKPLPTLVFLHGFGGGSSAYEWSQVFPAFASEYRILAPDLIGMGESGKNPTGSYLFRDHYRYLDAWFKQLLPEEQVTLTFAELASAAGITDDDLLAKFGSNVADPLSRFGKSSADTHLRRQGAMKRPKTPYDLPLRENPGDVEDVLPRRYRL